MYAYLAKRLIATLPTLFVISIVAFGLLHLLPGDPAAALAGRDATPQMIEQLRLRMGLDRPLYVQYAEWLGRVLRGDLGTSMRDGQPVAELIARRLPVSLELGTYALLLAVAMGVPAGILAATRRNSRLDGLVTAASMINISLPTFLLGLLMVYVISLRFHWLPAGGYVPIVEGLVPHLRVMIMPAIAHAGSTVASITRMTRSSVLDVLHEDYMRTAQAKGLRDGRLLFVHALRNALLPVVTMTGIHAGHLLGGAVISETIFTIPGMGALLVDALLSRDYPVVQASLLIYAVVFVMLNLVVDFSYTILDPRVRYD